MHRHMMAIMAHQYPNLLSTETPLTFADGSAIYGQLSQQVHTHDRGLFILAPSGAGKTYFIERQTSPEWIDGDHLWLSTNAQPDEQWWLRDDAGIQEIDCRSDIITMEAKKLGFWIIGASNHFLRPDAIVIPDWRTHKAWIHKRESTNFDGGATSERLEQVKRHRQRIRAWHKRGVPQFQTVDEAVTFLATN